MLVGMSVLVEMSVLVVMSVLVEMSMCWLGWVTSRQSHINLLSMCTHSDQCKELQLQLAQLVEIKQQLKEMLPDEPTRLTQRKLIFYLFHASVINRMNS